MAGIRCSGRCAGDGIFSGKYEKGYAVKPHPVAGGEVFSICLAVASSSMASTRSGSSVFLGDHSQLVDTADVTAFDEIGAIDGLGKFRIVGTRRNQHAMRHAAVRCARYGIETKLDPAVEAAAAIRP